MRRCARHFPDGIFWVTAGASADLVAGQIDLLRRLGVRRVRSCGRPATGSGCCARRWPSVAAWWWSMTSGRWRRRPRFVPPVRSAGCCTPPATRPSWRASAPRSGASTCFPSRLPASCCGRSRARASSLRRRSGSCEATGRVALAVALVGATIGTAREHWQEVVDELDRGAETFLDHPYAEHVQGDAGRDRRPGRA